jgi:hypothetical protein
VGHPRTQETAAIVSRETSKYACMLTTAEQRMSKQDTGHRKCFSPGWVVCSHRGKRQAFWGIQGRCPSGTALTPAIPSVIVSREITIVKAAGHVHVSRLGAKPPLPLSPGASEIRAPAVMTRASVSRCQSRLSWVATSLATRPRVGAPRAEHASCVRRRRSFSARYPPWCSTLRLGPPPWSSRWLQRSTKPCHHRRCAQHLVRPHGCLRNVQHTRIANSGRHRANPGPLANPRCFT